MRGLHCFARGTIIIKYGNDSCGSCHVNWNFISEVEYILVEIGMVF